MDYRTGRLILRHVTEDDLNGVMWTWPSDHRPLSEAEARDAIFRMRVNYGKNAAGRLVHLCLAVCSAEEPQTVMGWCGLDGSRDRREPEIFVLLEEGYRGKGYGTQCVKELLRIATEDYSLPGVHGGCAKDNLASRRIMEKGGMVQYGTEENGDPLFRFAAGEDAAIKFIRSEEMKIVLAPGQEEMLSTREDIRTIIRENPDTVMAFDIFEGEERIGFALVHRFEERKYFLWEYAIDKDHQNRGKGTRALKEFMAFLKTRYGAEEMTTTYIYGNEQAKRVYEKAGFLETDVVDEPGCHEVNMARRL